MKMHCSVLRLWLSLVFLLPLFKIAFAEINITYPTSGTVYPPTGPDTIGWTFSDGDPPNVTIYLATYSGKTLINNLYGLVWTTESGSVEITFKYPPVPGDTYTWMFYDASEAVQLNKNYIAQSAHFRIQSSSPSSTSTSTRTTTSSTSSTSKSATATGQGKGTTSATQQRKNGLSYGAVAAIAVVTTLFIVALCLLGAFFWFRKKLYWKNKNDDTKPFGKPELDGKGEMRSPSLPATERSREPEPPQTTTVAHPSGETSTSSSSHHHEVPASPQPRTTRPLLHWSRSEALPPATYEMYSNSQPADPGELGDNSAPGTIRRKEISLTNDDLVEHGPDASQDGRTASPQIPPAPNNRWYGARRKPVPPSHPQEFSAREL